MACSLISQCAAVEAVVAWVGMAGQAEMLASIGVNEAQAQGTLLSTQPTAKGLFLGLQLLSCNQWHTGVKNPLDKQLQSWDAPVLNLHSGPGLQVNDAFYTEDIRAACSPRDAFTSLTHFKRDIPCVGCLAVLLGEQPRGHHKSLHSPHSHTSPANTFTQCV